MNQPDKTENPLGTRDIPQLLRSLAIPAITANLINSLYNVVDQIFIGQGIGFLGNAATSIAFPLTTICMAFGLMLGLGSSANFNLALGRRDPQTARQAAGTAISMAILLGLLICVVTNLFLEPLLLLFGATPNILVYAKTYTRITSFGIPFLLFSTGTNPLVRADGSPTYSMMAILSGALLNTVLDPVFIFLCHWGVAGAAAATLISQILSAFILVLYLPRFRSVRFERTDFRPRADALWKVASLGISSFIFQSSNLVIQIVTNNTLRRYGALSVYGSDVVIAIAGIVAKIKTISGSVIIGLVQGAQPIIGFNYGAENYARVRATLRLLMKTAFCITSAAFLVFEFFPRQLIALFGNGSQLYIQFGVKYIRVYLFCTFINGMQVAGTNYFQAIGKASRGAILSLAKQLVFLLPMIVILPRFFGVSGVMYAAPISDSLAFLLTILLLFLELRRTPRQ